MILQEFYDRVLSVVSHELKMSSEELLHSRKESCSDGRYIFVSVLGEYMTDDEISFYSGLTRSCANKIRNGFSERKHRKYSLRLLHSRILQEVRNLAENSWGWVIKY